MSLNVKNRTLFTGDNLDVLRGINSECVDLVYLDPPFNSNRDYAAPIGSEAAGAAFKDTWTLSDVDVAWIGLIAEKEPALATIIESAGLAHGKGMQAYLTMMAVRLVELRRVLKPTGSIYLHCDPTASHYLKLIMDCVYGQGNFRNHIAWLRTKTHNDSRNAFPNLNDALLFYGASEQAAFRPIKVAHSPEYVKKYYRDDDGDGRGPYQLDNMASPNPRPNMMYEWRGFPHPAKGWRYEESTMKRLDEEGRVHYPTHSDGSFDYSRRPRLKRYLREQKGIILGDVWVDINPINSQAKERTGYPTQKPLALLERIIKASSNEGDVVLDPFCGCATALVAAETYDRQWVGIDLSSLAAKLVKQRLRKGGELFYEIHHRTDIPKRTDIGKLPPYKTHRHTLYGKQEGKCAGCQHHFPFQNFTVDHIVPRSKGGTDHLENLQLLCNYCNSTKGAMDQATFMAKLKAQGMI